MNDQHFCIMISEHFLDSALIELRSQHVARSAHRVTEMAMNQLDWTIFTQVLIRHMNSS
jgi:hypothetical protein